MVLKALALLGAGLVAGCADPSSVVMSRDSYGIGYLPDGREIVFRGTGSATIDGNGVLELISDAVLYQGQEIRVRCSGTFYVARGQTTGGGTFTCPMSDNPGLDMNVAGSFTLQTDRSRLNGVGSGTVTGNLPFVFGYGTEADEAAVRARLPAF